MNIDLLIRKYYLKLREIEKKENKTILANLTNLKRPNTQLVLVIFLCLFISLAIMIIGLAREIWWVAITSFIVMISVCIIMEIYTRTDKEIKRRVITNERYHRVRIKALLEILYEHSISTDRDSINNLIEETKRNKAKYAFFHKSEKSREDESKQNKTSLIKELIGLVAALVSLIAAVVGLVSKNVIPIEMFSSLVSFIVEKYNNSDMTYLIPQIGFVSLEVLILIVVLIRVYMTMIDPFVRKIYFFHDTFLYYLKQLLLFKDYYENQRLLDSSNQTSADRR